MALENQIQDTIKKAMIAKDQAALRALRAAKSAILMAKTETGSKDSISDEDVLKILQKLVKQREESLSVYKKQNRADLAQGEQEELDILLPFLPKQLSDAELETIVGEAIKATGATTKAEMGKVIGMAMAKAAGSADGKRISQEVAKQLG